MPKPRSSSVKPRARRAAASLPKSLFATLDHPMAAFLADTLDPTTIYDLLVVDFAHDGKAVTGPLNLLIPPPPAGLGYGSIQAAQAFLDTYVNSTTGRVRYHLAPGAQVTFTAIPTPRHVGHLAWLISTLQA